MRPEQLPPQDKPGMCLDRALGLRIITTGLVMGRVISTPFSTPSPRATMINTTAVFPVWTF